jgi:hypothetical protein
MNATLIETGVGGRGRWDAPVAQLSPAQAEAVARFHARTRHQFSQVRELALLGRYALLNGWDDISEVLVPKAGN